MPLKMIIEKGEPDLIRPAILCDVCGEEITSSSGNFHWRHDYSLPEADLYKQQSDIYFVHTACDCQLSAAKLECNWQPFVVETPWGMLDSRNVLSDWHHLNHFMTWLARNLNMICFRRNVHRSEKERDIQCCEYKP